MELIREKELVRMLHVSRSGIRRWVTEGRFPQPIRLGERSIAWRLEEIEEWRANVAPAWGRTWGKKNEND